MAYLIGELASITGLSIEGIRKYERAGIISPERSDNSQYRQYRYLDITCMIRCRAYRALGFSLREIAEMTNSDDLPEILERFEARENEMNQDIRLLSMKQRLLHEKIDLLSSLDSRLNSIEILPSPSFYRIEFAKNGEIIKCEELIKLCRQWMEYAPFVQISTRYHNEDTYGGLLIREPYAGLFPLEENSFVRYYPSRIGLQICVSEEGDCHAAAECAEALHQFATEHRFQAEDDAFGQSVISIQKVSRYRRYRIISVGISY